jgi:hypothetical protein
MNHPEFRRTTIELLLLVWSILNFAIGIWVIYVAQVPFFGAGLTMSLHQVIIVFPAIFLIWRLLKPTRGILLFGTLYWALQSIGIKFPDTLYNYRHGLCVDIRLIDYPDYIFTVNLVAIITTILFAYAAMARPASVIAPTQST